MNNRTLAEICADLEIFYSLIKNMKDNPDSQVQYETHLRYPAWRSELPGGKKMPPRDAPPPEDFADDVSADKSKLNDHVAWLLNPTQSMLSEKINKDTIERIAQRIKSDVELYHPHAKDDQQKNELCKRILSDLKDIRNILDSTRPTNEPPKPGSHE